MNLLKEKEIYTVFHYAPLHSSPAGERYGMTEGKLTITDEISETLVRLPLWLGFEDMQEQVIEQMKNIIMKG